VIRWPRSTQRATFFVLFLSLLIVSEGGCSPSPQIGIRTMWVQAKSALRIRSPESNEDNALGSFSTGLMWIEKAMPLEIGNLQADGTYWSLVNGIDYRVHENDARLAALIGHMTAIYILDVSEENEHWRKLHESISDEDIPF
jgi:hypothetical protein